MYYIATFIAGFIAGAVVYALVIKKNPKVQADVAAAADTAQGAAKKL